MEPNLDSHLQSRSPSPCGSEGRCRDPQPLGCPPRSAGGPIAQKRSGWRPDGAIRPGLIKSLLAKRLLIPTTHLRSETDVVVPHEAGVGVVFDVLALDVMFQVEEGFAWSLCHLHHVHLHDVHLRRRGGCVGFYSHVQYRPCGFFCYQTFQKDAVIVFMPKYWKLHTFSETTGQLMYLGFLVRK